MLMEFGSLLREICFVFVWIFLVFSSYFFKVGCVIELLLVKSLCLMILSYCNGYFIVDMFIFGWKRIVFFSSMNFCIVS